MIDKIKNMYKSLKQDTVENKKCVGCAGCCEFITILSAAEFELINKYLKKTRKGNWTLNRAIGRWNRQICISDKMCPFLNEKNQCEIYSVRPSLCRMFHCNTKHNFINSLPNDYLKQGYYGIGDFFIIDAGIKLTKEKLKI